ncbi:hypothetical protein GW17_00004197 [Ensete ventricosum]|nr:hypothetical protein GW17_00004197 [Ensete ventricosum]
MLDAVAETSASCVFFLCSVVTSVYVTAISAFTSSNCWYCFSFCCHCIFSYVCKAILSSSFTAPFLILILLCSSLSPPFILAAFQNENCQLEEPSSPANATAVAPSVLARPILSASIADYSAVPSISHTVASDICSENIDEIPELGTPKKAKNQVSEASTVPLALVHDLVSSTVAIGDDLIGESSLEQPEDLIRGKLNHKKEHHALEQMIDGSSSRDRIESISDQNHDKLYGHSRNLSAESIGSDISSIRGSELSAAGVTNSIWEVSPDVPGGAEIPNIMDALPHANTQFFDKAQIVLPIDQRLKLNRVIVNMQQRVVTARTDMEDLIARLNQEMAVKEYLTTKVHL